MSRKTIRHALTLKFEIGPRLDRLYTHQFQFVEGLYCRVLEYLEALMRHGFQKEGIPLPGAAAPAEKTPEPGTCAQCKSAPIAPGCTALCEGCILAPHPQETANTTIEG